jgi:hypothetical protein
MRRGVLATAVLATAVLAVGCGDDGGGSDPSDAVTSQLEETFPDLEVSTDCPDDPGRTFDCTVTIGSDELTVPVEDDDGTVELTAVVVNVGEVERKIETEYDRDQGVAASAECGDSPDTAALVEKVGATFTCTVEPSGGAASGATVTVENLDGTVSIAF